MKKRHYVIEFMYSDNDQLYQTDVLLTKTESEQLEVLLQELQLKGYIYATAEGAASLYLYHSPKPISSLRSALIALGRALPTAMKTCHLCEGTGCSGVDKDCSFCNGQGEVPIIPEPKQRKKAKLDATAEVSS